MAVLGAGPAGLAAAVAAADAGCSVALVDEGPGLGGQYWRHRPGVSGTSAHGAHSWKRFIRLRSLLDRHIARGLAHHLAGWETWHASSGDRGFTVHADVGGSPAAVTAPRLVLATGSVDRHLPFPGWELPGVMAVGGAQALIKGQGVVPGRRAAVAGTGPLLLPVAVQLAEAGVEVAGVFEAGSPIGFVRHPGALALNPGKLAEGARHARGLWRHRIPYRVRQAVVAAHGDSGVEAVTVARVDRDLRVVPGSERRLACDLLAVGYGFTPQVELALLLGCATRVDADGSLAVDVDGDQATSVTGVYAAGETTGVGGADLAVVEGELAGRAAAISLGRRRPGGGLGLRVRRAALRRFATALHRAHPVPDGWIGWARDDTLVCRCEEVPVWRVREAVRDLGAGEPRTVKLFARPGMGWCQGRICGFAVARLTADLSGRPVTRADLEGLAARPIARPVPLGLLAAEADQGQQ